MSYAPSSFQEEASSAQLPTVLSVPVFPLDLPEKGAGLTLTTRKTPLRLDWLHLLHHWERGVLGLLLCVVASSVLCLLWPQPQAEITLKPYQVAPLASEPVPQRTEAALPSTPASETDGALAQATSTSKRHRAGHGALKKPKHPPVIAMNTATLAQWQLLPGIGPKMAQRVLDYRKTHGPFHDPAEILEVKGIGPKKFEKMRPFLKL